MKNFLLLFLVFNSFVSFSQTLVSGGIFSNQQWDLSGSPYIVTGDVAIYPGNTLTVDPGVEIKVDGNYSIFIRGEIILNGNASNPITFKSNSSPQMNNAWAGLIFENLSGSNIKLNHVNVENANDAISIDQSIGDISIKNCSFRNSENGIILQSSSSSFEVTIDSSSFQDVSYGVFFADKLTIENCQFSNGIKAVYGGLWGNTLKINNCSFDNFTGEYTLNIGGDLLNSTISNCDRGVRLRPSLTVTYCDFSDNNIATEISSSSNYNSSLSFNTFCNNVTDIKHFYNYNIDMSNNCWCAIDNNPDDGIIDAYDDVALGIVTYLPFASSCTFTSIGYPTNILNSKVVIYPNPASQELFIKNGDKIEYVNIIDYSGKILITTSNINGINIHGLAAGVYLVRMYSEGSYTTQKLIKN